MLSSLSTGPSASRANSTIGDDGRVGLGGEVKGRNVCNGARSEDSENDKIDEEEDEDEDEVDALLHDRARVDDVFLSTTSTRISLTEEEDWVDRATSG